MRIVIDLTPVYDHLTGIERYNINISKEIIKAHPENEYILIFKNEVHDSFQKEVQKSNVKNVIIGGCNKLLFIQWKLYKELKKINADYYMFLSFTSPVLFRKQRIINAIHDLTCWDCPESMPAKMKYYYRYTYKIAAKRSWKLVTVSNFSQKRICEKYRLSEYKVPVIYDGLTDIFVEKPHDNPKLKTKYGLPDKYILSLSTLEPRKNLQLLIRAYKELLEADEDLPVLVLAGRKGWKLEEFIGDVTQKVKKRIVFTGFIDEEDLAQIYREADLFVFASKYEGFGLPVIEAMSQGTVVVCSDAASLPEIVSGAGIMFHSDNINSLKQAIKKALLLDENTRKKQVLLGIKISRKFSWAKESEKLYSLMRM